MSIQTQGFKRNSPYKGMKKIKIDSNVITMDGVDFPLLITESDGTQRILPPNSGEHKVKGPVIEQRFQDGGLSEIQMKIDSLQKIIPAFIAKEDDPLYLQKKTKWNTLYKRDRDLLGELKDKKALLEQGHILGDMEGSSKSKSKTKLYAMKKGGKVPVYPESKDIQNAEVEGGETVFTPDGNLMKFEGASHAQGGIPVFLEGGSKIFSEHLQAPQELVNMILEKKTKKKYSYADLSKKFPTDQSIKDLENSSDEFQKNAAYTKLVMNQSKLETLFKSQEEVKNNEDISNYFQKGGQVQDLSGVSNRFQTVGKNRFLDPVTGKYYVRGEITGKYTEFNPPEVTILESRIKPNLYPDNIVTPVEGLGLLAKGIKNKYGKSQSSDSEFKTEQGVEFDNPYPLNIESRSLSKKQKEGPTLMSYWELLDEYNSIGPTPVLNLPENKQEENLKVDIPASTVVKSTRRKSSTKVKNKVPFYNTKQDGEMRDLEQDFPESQFTYPEIQDRHSLVEDVNPTDIQEESGAEVQLKQERANNRAKRVLGNLSFLPGSKAAGTILDIGLALSDKVTVDTPNYRDNRKYPIFNRFVNFEDKNVSKQHAKAIESIQNSNVPEAVKQAQISALNASTQEYQAQVDFANVQRYEEKLGRDTEKLQGYMDRNIDIATNDIDVHRQKIARVNELVDKFKAQRKERVVNSLRNYSDYVEQTQAINEMMPNVSLNPWTGKTKVKNNTNPFESVDAAMQGFVRNSNNTVDLGNGATAKQINGVWVSVDKDGKVSVIK